MKKQILKAIGGTALLMLALTVVAHVCVPAQAQNGNEQSLIGSWSEQVTIRDCQSGTALFGFPAMFTYNHGGTMQESDIGDPALIRLLGHGVWERQNGRHYSASFQFLNFNLDHTPAGKNVVRSTITLSPNGTSYTSTDSVEILNPNGDLMFRGCATATATRFE